MEFAARQLAPASDCAANFVEPRPKSGKNNGFCVVLVVELVVGEPNMVQPDEDDDEDESGELLLLVKVSQNLRRPEEACEAPCVVCAFEAPCNKGGL